jgi:uncharacterized membrane protein
VNSPLTKKRASAYLAFILLAVFALTSQHSLCEETTPETLILTVYSDGFTFVDYTISVDKTFPTQIITIFGLVAEDLLVVDSNGLPLSYQLNASELTVHSLGTEEVGITYVTQDLTSKDGRYWTLTLNSPVNAQIKLPTESAIISLNKVPDVIETNGDQVTLVMNSGEIQVTYVIGVVGTQEHAQIVINDAETAINAIKNSGIIISEAEAKLQEAQTAFNVGNYAEAETLANQAQTLATQTNQTANQAIDKISQAQNAITNAENEERTTGIDDSQKLLAQANSQYELGNYSEALSLATQALQQAENATSFMSENSGDWLAYAVIASVVVLAVAGFYFVVVRPKKAPEATQKPKRKIDVERIFSAHLDLMPEEKQAIQFLADNDGEAFEAELYDHVKLPRTTTWRLVKRLKRMEIITVTKFRRQNLVRVKRKYDVKE